MVDIVLVGVLLATAARGMLRGAVAGINSDSCLVLGIGGAAVLYRRLNDLVGGLLGEASWQGALSFGLAFLVVFLAAKLCGRLLRRRLGELQAPTLDRLLGLLLGAAEGALVVGVLLLSFRWHNVVNGAVLLEDSWFERALFSVLPPLDEPGLLE